MFTQNQKILNILFKAVSDGVLIADKSQTIIAANSAAKRMFGYEIEELYKKRLPHLISKNYPLNYALYFNEPISEQEHPHLTFKHPHFGIRKDGSMFPIKTKLNPFNLRGKKYVMTLIIDLSLLKKQEQKIKQLTTALENKTMERTHVLETTIDKLKAVNIELNYENKKRIQIEKKVKTTFAKEQELNDLKAKFIALLSHEFKTPLSGILTSTILLRKYELTTQQKKRNKHINIIANKVHYLNTILNTILNDFLSIEKLETGTFSYHPKLFKVSNLIQELVQNASMFLKEGQKINYSDNIDAFSMFQDKKIIALTLFNVVHNAIIYSPENTPIDIIILQNNMETIFKVKNKGIGIPEKDQKKIFKRYYSAENVLLIQGTGIGLSIAKQHTENLGGTVHFTSKEHSETIFSITIPTKAYS